MCGASESRRGCFSALLELALFLLWLTNPALLRAETISGTVQDPSGAVIVGARVEIAGGELAQAIVLSSDALGKFASPDLQPATYTLRVSRDGFETLVRTVNLQGSVVLQFTLSLAKQHVDVTVFGKSLAFANSDLVYRQLREVGLGQSFRFDNFTLTWDAASFQFHKGTLTFVSPVDGVVTGAIFVGDGDFTLKPVSPLDVRELKRRTGASEVSEDFAEVIFRFTGEARLRFFSGLGEQTETPSDAAAVFHQWKEKMRQHRDPAVGFTQYLLQGEAMDNVDADLLAAIYNPEHPPFFNAYLRGKKHKDLRFFVRARVGALPQMDSPEEVALINVDADAMDDGVWYLAHLKSEYLNHTADSREDRRLFATQSYKIETVIANNGHLFSTATINFESLVAGERVLKFGLLPNLRVTRVADELGKNIYFIQESRKQDGSFYAILSQPPPIGREQSINVEYAGDKVLEEAGEGSFYVGARTSWYPNLNGFGERALYDLTFKVPRKYKVISVGKLRDESIDQDLAVSHWVTPRPVAVAGFNYGEYKKLELPDEKTGYKISGYYLEELPSNLRENRALQSMAPKSMTKYALEQARAQLQLCTFYFGQSPFDEIYITEQPNFNFGQSWPNLIYLPISEYTDSTERWMLFARINDKFTGFVQEVTPHEVSHQWWGHAVGWASYHDQWLSEGFAEFSAGLFLQQGVTGDWRKDYIEFWERLRRRILEKNNYGIAPNDAGPLWMGLRLDSPRTENAYQNVIYPKGAYVLQMLRAMMFDPQEQDKPFIAMMQDFVASHRDRAATTESFKTVAEKHMTRMMDMGRNGRLDWFFDEWVYGTQVPRYHFEYQINHGDGGKVKLHMTITQSEVDEHFSMLVPVFADFGEGMVRIGQVAMAGDTTRAVDFTLPIQPKKVALNAYKEILER
jgi:Peptidase family M1 domain/Carboxypeptidase regulatory-like domain